MPCFMSSPVEGAGQCVGWGARTRDHFIFLPASHCHPQLLSDQKENQKDRLVFLTGMGRWGAGLCARVG